MILQIITIARNTLVESLRQPVVCILILLSAVAQAFATASTGFSMGMEESGEVSADNKLLLDIGLSTVFGLATVLAAFVATAVMSREIENKTVLTVVSKPVPRPAVVVGKYLGVVGTILIATVTMLLFLLMGIRHGVLMTAADDADMPVILFGTGAIFLSIALAAWCNFFYGWSFTQAVVLLLLPLTLLAYIGTLFVDKHWSVQDPLLNIKPQITLACICLGMAVLVLTAIATAASTRLSQVMTMIVCVGAFGASLLSNYFLGQHAFDNTIVARIARVEPLDPRRLNFENPGDGYKIELESDPSVTLAAGASFYYSYSPNGYPLFVKAFPPFEGDPGSERALFASRTPALVITSVDGRRLTVRKAGEEPIRTTRPPETLDYVFITPTTTRPLYLVPWAVLPNLQHFWLLDAITQNQPVNNLHVMLVLLYGLAQIGAFLSLAVILFQKRDVG